MRGGHPRCCLVFLLLCILVSSPEGTCSCSSLSARFPVGALRRVLFDPHSGANRWTLCLGNADPCSAIKLTLAHQAFRRAEVSHGSLTQFLRELQVASICPAQRSAASPVWDPSPTRPLEATRQAGRQPVRLGKRAGRCPHHGRNTIAGSPLACAQSCQPVRHGYRALGKTPTTGLGQGFTFGKRIQIEPMTGPFTMPSESSKKVGQ